MKIHLYRLIAGAVLIGLAACGKVALAPTATSTAFPTNTPAPTATATLAATLQPDDSQRTLTVNGLERTYLLHIPSGINAGQSVPLVFVFHGYSENATYIQQMSGFNDIADKGGFFVVYPSGKDLSWNAGGCCGSGMTENIDEAAFIRQIISDLGTVAKIDPKRTYATGFSNGALLSYRLACEMSDTFAAVAPVAGALITDPCQPGQSVSVIHFHGLNDPVVPYPGGGTVDGTGQPFPPTEQSIAAWAQIDGCAESPTVEQTAIFTHTAYTSCKNGTAVELYAVKGIGHIWPSQYIVPDSQLIWDFFAAHPKP